MATNVTDLQKREGSDLAKMGFKDQVKYLLEQNKDAIRSALPKHINPDRLLQVAITTAVTTPALKTCYVPSLIGGIMQCSAMGLEPNTVLGHAYLIPFRNRKKNRTDVQVIVGYKGLIDLARRSGQIVSIAAHEVYSNDEFDYMYGLHEKLEHKPAEGERGEIKYFYAVAHMKDGGHAFEVMTKAAVDLIMKNTQGKGESGPWRDNYTQMGRKTLIRRLANYLPLSVDLARAVNLDELSSAGADQALDRALEGDFETVAADAPHQGSTDVIHDSDGVAFDPELHVHSDQAPVFNKDGSFRKKRGAGTRGQAADNGGDGGQQQQSSGSGEPDDKGAQTPPPPPPGGDDFQME